MINNRVVQDPTDKTSRRVWTPPFGWSIQKLDRGSRTRRWIHLRWDTTIPAPPESPAQLSAHPLDKLFCETEFAIRTYVQDSELSDELLRHLQSINESQPTELQIHSLALILFGVSKYLGDHPNESTPS